MRCDVQWGLCAGNNILRGEKNLCEAKGCSIDFRCTMDGNSAPRRVTTAVTPAAVRKGEKDSEYPIYPISD